MLPFTFISESGYAEDLGYNAQLSFTIASSNSPYMIYDAIIDRDNGAYTTTLEQPATVYVPQDEKAKYEHRASFYVDVIAKDINGIKSVRTSVEPNMYQFEEIEDVFYTPKFTWDTNSNVSSTTTTTTPLAELENMFWTASGNALYACKYSRESASAVYASALESPVNNTVLSSNQMYVSTNNYLTRYINDVFSSYKEITRKNSVTNDNRAIISLHSNSAAWSVQAYDGKVVKLDATTLSSLYEYTGLDAPFKIRWSEYHNCYFVAGTYLLWKIDDVAKTIENVYEINDYQIKDFDVSENGQICLIFNGVNNSVLRVLDSDRYTFLLNEITTDTLRFCKYCNEGRFYAIGELSSQGTVYSSIHYLFNCTTKQLQKISSEQALAFTTTTTTLGTVTQPVKITYPIGGEELQIGQAYDIRWESNKGFSDLVKIELYLSGSLYRTIFEEAKNTGVYHWQIPSNTKEDSRYKIRVTWLSASSDVGNYSESAEFTINKIATVTTTTTTALITESCAGVDYDDNNDQVLILLKSGLLGFFELSTLDFYGLIDCGIQNVNYIVTQNIRVGRNNLQQKVRIFVGSQIGYSDKWDSGEVTTSLKSMYYGGGANLIAGQTYYVQIQTYMENEGWSEVNLSQFTMPVW